MFLLLCSDDTANPDDSPKMSKYHINKIAKSMAALLPVDPINALAVLMVFLTLSVVAPLYALTNPMLPAILKSLKYVSKHEFITRLRKFN